MGSTWDGKHPAAPSYFAVGCVGAAAVFAVGLGLAVTADRNAEPPAPADPVDVASPAARSTPPTYDRAAFGRAWVDVDGNGCDTRNDVLARDLVRERLDADGCRVLDGELVDPYTGAVVFFVRGTTTSGEVPVDHVYALADAWDDGAWRWTPEQRLAFANDPRNLVATTRSVNSAKGARGPADWAPAAGDCAYLRTYVLVGATYGLEVDAGDAAALDARLDGCALTGR